MARHWIYFPDVPAAGRVTITGPEAQHAARVKRLEAGDEVTLAGGRGVVAICRVVETRKERRSGEWEMDVDVTERREAARARPEVRVYASPPKGDRLEEMIDGISQAGAAGWAALMTKHTVVEPREGKLERLERTAVEAMKQCGRAWVLEMLGPVAFGRALERAARPVIADASGGAYVASGAEAIDLFVGPEGGWSEEELAAARARGAQVARFGPHVMRVETAAVVGVGVVMATEGRG